MQITLSDRIEEVLRAAAAETPPRLMSADEVATHIHGYHAGQNNAVWARIRKLTYEVAKENGFELKKIKKQANPHSQLSIIRGYIRDFVVAVNLPRQTYPELVALVCRQRGVSVPTDPIAYRNIETAVRSAALLENYSVVPKEDSAKIRELIALYQTETRKKPPTAEEFAARVFTLDREERNETQLHDLIGTIYKVSKKSDFKLQSTQRVVKKGSLYSIARTVIADAQDADEKLTTQEAARRVVLKAKIKIKNKKAWHILLTTVRTAGKRADFIFEAADNESQNIRRILLDAKKRGIRLSVYDVAAHLAMEENIVLSEENQKNRHNRIWRTAKEEKYKLKPAKDQAHFIRHVLRYAKKSKSTPFTVEEIAIRACQAMGENFIGRERELFFDNIYRIAKKEKYEFKRVVRKGRSRDQHNHFILPPTPLQSASHLLEQAYLAGQELTTPQLVERMADSHEIKNPDTLRERADLALIKKLSFGPMRDVLCIPTTNPRHFSAAEAHFIEGLMDCVLPHADDAHITPAMLSEHGYNGLNELAVARVFPSSFNRQPLLVRRLFPLAARYVFYHARHNTNGLLEWYAERKRPQAHAPVTEALKLTGT